MQNHQEKPGGLWGKNGVRDTALKNSPVSLKETRTHNSNTVVHITAADLGKQLQLACGSGTGGGVAAGELLRTDGGRAIQN